jgi:putative FmdB family regulatory protein
MPIYEYRCDSCGCQKEYLQKVNDPVLTTCPECGQATFKKQLTAAGFQLKGSGWYATDFKHNGSKPAEQKTDGGSKTAGEPKTDGGDAKTGAGESKTGAESKTATGPKQSESATS